MNWLLPAVAVAIVVYLVITFNGLTRLRMLARNAWSDIDVQLRRRHDLVPVLVSTVKGHAGYEKGTLEAVVEARNRMTAPCVVDVPSRRASCPGPGCVMQGAVARSIL